MELLEYLVRLRGAGAAAAEMRGLASEMGGLAAAQTKVAASGDAAAASGRRLGGVMALAGKATLGIGAALVGVGLEAVKASNQFNHEMLRIRTDAGASTRELRNMKQGVLDLAASGASMGQGPMSLAQGLYHLESLGIRGAKALHALKLASQETAISGANLEQTTSALGAAIYVGIKGTGNLDRTMGILNATVGAGNMRFQDLVDALGTGILASSKVAGLSIHDVGAALAVLSDGGQHAASGAAQLATALHFLYAPSGKAQTALKSIGLSGTALALDMHKPRGLLVALTDLRAHLHGLSQVQQAQTLSAILPGGRGRVLLSLIEQLDRLKGKYDQINHTARSFGSSVAMQRHDPTTQLHTAEARAQADLIRLGNVLTPIVTPALTALINAGSSLLEWLTKLPHAIGSVIRWFENLGSGSSKTGKALSSIGKTATGLWHTIQVAFTAIGNAAHKVFAGSFVKDLGTIGKKLLEFGATVFRILGPFLRGVINSFVSMVRGAFNIIGGIVKIIAGLLTGDFSKAWNGLKQVVRGVVDFIRAQVQLFFGAAQSIGNAIVSGLSFIGGALLKIGQDAINGLISVLNTGIDGINSALSAIPNPGDWFGASIPTVPHIPSIGGGGGSPAAPTVPAGSGSRSPVGGTGHMQVTHNLARASHTVRAGVGQGGGITIHANFDHPIIVNGHEVARAHRREVVKAMAAGA